jgi:hypothetical protein
MPKNTIDYSNTIIYKIFCKDQTVTDTYIGHTTNFVKRKYQHKIMANCSKQLKIYETIQNNGGWDNWNMIEIATYNCKDSTEARIREQEHCDLLKPSLNLINPITKNKYFVKDIDPVEDSDLKNTYYCEHCEYSCIKKYNWDRHLITSKHKKMLQGDKFASLPVKNEQPIIIDTSIINNSKYTCDICNKQYNSRNGIWKHKKICGPNTKEQDTIQTQTKNDILDKELIMMLIKDNSELKNLLMKVVENGINNTTNNNTTTNVNSHNKAFNLNFFLNETCKDAMNMSDFISSIKLNLEDLENTGRRGYIEGISNIILKNLNNIEQHMRPLHCSDTKREILYVKDNDKWEKETDDKPILTKAIKVIANENIKQIKNWAEKNPDCTASDSRKNDLYLKIVSNSMNGLTEEEGKKNINKIISNVAKEMTIQKDIN